jgi:hypothetical protein
MKLSFALYLILLVVSIYADQIPRSHQLDLQATSKQHLLR